METTSRNSSTDSQNHDTNVNVAIPFAPNFATSASQQKGSQQTSPFAITSMLHDLSIATPGVTSGPTSDISTNKNSGSLVDSLLADIGHGPYLLKIGQIPEDLTERESHLIFSLADGIESVRLVDDKDGKEVEKEHKSNVSEPGKRIEATMKNLRLLAQYATILSRKDTLFGPQQSKKCTIEAIDQESNKSIDLELLKQVFEAHKSMHPEHKNESIGQRHSRFSFNDPFSSEGVNSSLVFQTNQSNQSSNPATQLSGISENPVPIESTIHQSNRANSFLVRENNDINESIWNDNGINNSLNGLVASSQPQTPSVDWTGQMIERNLQHSISQIILLKQMLCQLQQEPNKHKLVWPASYHRVNLANKCKSTPIWECQMLVNHLLRLPRCHHLMWYLNFMVMVNHLSIQ